MKFIYFTDVHYGANPVCRKDIYNVSILNKLKYIVEYANNENIELLVCGGDLFDRPHQNYADLIEIFSLIKSSGCKWVINRGNPTHDGIVENSPLTLLSSMECSNVITPESCGSYCPQNPEVSCEFLFCPNSQDLEKFEPKPLGKETKFILTHHILVSKPVPYKHTLCSDFAKKLDDAYTVFIADYHPEQGEIYYPNANGEQIRFISTGSICRRKYTKDNIEKEPKFAVFDIATGECKFVKIPCVKDVWNQPDDKQIAETEFDIDAFRENIDDFQNEISLESAWHKYCEINDVPNGARFIIFNKIFRKNYQN